MAVIVSLVGPTGSGKTTIANAMLSVFDATLIKIAAPIYEMQEYLYNKLGMAVNSQDGELLQYLASKIERESPGWLAKKFIENARENTSALIINDDCRLNAYRYLQNEGILFIRVVTSQATRRKRLRSDHIHLDVHHETEKGFSHIDCKYSVDNNGPLSITVNTLVELLSRELEHSVFFDNRGAMS